MLCPAVSDMHRIFPMCAGAVGAAGGAVGGAVGRHTAGRAARESLHGAVMGRQGQHSCNLSALCTPLQASLCPCEPSTADSCACCFCGTSVSFFTVETVSSWTVLQALADGADEFLQLLNMGSQLHQAFHS